MRRRPGGKYGSVGGQDAHGEREGGRKCEEGVCETVWGQGEQAVVHSPICSLKMPLREQQVAALVPVVLLDGSSTPCLAPLGAFPEPTPQGVCLSFFSFCLFSPPTPGSLVVLLFPSLPRNSPDFPSSPSSLPPSFPERREIPCT